MAFPTEAVRRQLDRGHGIVSRQRLLVLGASPSAIRRRIQNGELVAVAPGVYRAAARPLTPELRIRAVLLRLGGTAVLCGRWAAWWHDLLPPRSQPFDLPVHVYLPADGRCPRWPGLVVLRRPLSPVDRERRRGLLVTTRARTVLDCAGDPGAASIRDVALQRGTTMASLVGAMERLSPGHGSPAARVLLDPVRDGGVSAPERELLRGLRRAGGQEWVAGVHVTNGGGRYWLDLAQVRARLAVEVDGWTAHSAGTAFHDDRQRQNDLVCDGWTVLRYTPVQLRRRAGAVIQEIRAVEARLLRTPAEAAGSVR